MPRIGPLQELPLEHFIPSRKRPLSPAAHVLCSPAKRRILNEEGIFKSAVSGRGTPARFTKVLSGPSSPARKLDFGSPKQKATLGRATLASSPDLNTLLSEDYEMEDCFGQASCSSFSVRTPPSNPTIISRGTPPPPDPQSIHYPGFRVYFDTHIVFTPADEQPPRPSTPISEKDKDALKENIIPPRRPRKAVTAPDVDLKAQLFCPYARKREIERLGKVNSTPATPKVFTSDLSKRAGSPTPRWPVYDRVCAEASSTSSLLETERRAMRKLLQKEVDDEELTNT
ncbi:hypothetical protein H0H81_004165 [Sphagnurus paluster]|uniref:Uncharacterized protein n=1 Tax=Sphagnurus paluster TaxID=117069 RepID=A0A9P7GM83_9AGAR|nr:hypothetical protein H0H81_004165 [Sphagnurus paluster]